MNTVTENDNQSKSRKYFWQMQSVKEATKKEIKLRNNKIILVYDF